MPNFIFLRKWRQWRSAGPDKSIAQLPGTRPNFGWASYFLFHLPRKMYKIYREYCNSEPFSRCCGMPGKWLKLGFVRPWRSVTRTLEVRSGKYLSSIIALSRQPKDNLSLVTSRHRALKVASPGGVTRACYTKIIEAVFLQKILCNHLPASFFFFLFFF